MARDRADSVFQSLTRFSIAVALLGLPVGISSAKRLLLTTITWPLLNDSTSTSYLILSSPGFPILMT
jgi:hypothetical protein